MKKTLALLLCLAMLFTALTVNVFAAENPTVTIVTNSVSEDGETSFAIKFAGYTSLKGYDLVIKAGTGLNLLSASALNAETDLAEGVNYKIENNELHIVELTKVDGDDIITVDAKFAENQTAAVKVEVIKCDLAESSSQLYAEATIDPVSIAPYVAPATDVELPAIPEDDEDGKVKIDHEEAAGEGYFIPYGSVFTGSAEAPEYVAKDKDGKFNVAAGTTVQAFKIPEGGFGTFGISNSTVGEEDARQFGNVATGYTADRKYGSLVIVGQWTAFKEYYLSKKAFTENDLIEKIFASSNRVIAEQNVDYVIFNAGTASIKVYNVAQKNYMWKSETLNMLEYAVRVYGLLENTEYAVAAYNTDANGTDAVFSKEIRSLNYEG